MATDPSAFPDGNPAHRGREWLNPDEAMTPRDVERLLAKLHNEGIRAEKERRKLADHRLDCKVAYEKALIIATMDPECPKPNRTDVTVAQRDAWLRGVIFDEWEALQMAEQNLEHQDRYLRDLSEGTSKVQTISGHVKQAYAMPQSGYGS